MKNMDKIREAARDPYGYAESYKTRTRKKVVGYFCSYAPEEIIWAAGALPFRIFSRKSGIHLADRHLQSYCCSLVRGVLEEALSGALKFWTASFSPTPATRFSVFPISGGSTSPMAFTSMWSCPSSSIRTAPERI
jgi:benzoyl-CoA reductase/2-hydroxyglutaryl-CoA dehydratase subunit BcrC/BadD/HgdB